MVVPVFSWLHTLQWLVIKVVAQKPEIFRTTYLLDLTMRMLMQPNFLKYLITGSKYCWIIDFNILAIAYTHTHTQLKYRITIILITPFKKLCEQVKKKEKFLIDMQLFYYMIATVHWIVSNLLYGLDQSLEFTRPKQ